MLTDRLMVTINALNSRQDGLVLSSHGIGTQFCLIIF